MLDLSIFATPEAWVALLSLTLLEIVLGLDNIVFISIITGKLPEEQRSTGRRVGLVLALGMRIALLFAISSIMKLRETLFTVMDEAISGRDLILGLGGLFLIGKATQEMFEKIELASSSAPTIRRSGFAMAMAQIMVLDIIFSLDSVITAVGMANDIEVMVVAMIIAVGVMVAFADSIGHFVEKYKSVTILALSFLLLIGITLLAEAVDQQVNKGYIYFAMAFAMSIELINIRVRKVEARRSEPADPEPVTD